MYHDSFTCINNAKKITILSHVTPDGDALGSSLALYLSLKLQSKNVKIFNATPILAKRYDFLPSYNKITHIFPKNCDLIIAFDCGSFDRLGIEKSDITLLNIDHHKSNTQYGDYNIVDDSFASTSALLYTLMQAWQLPLNQEIATCIYTALAEDTNFFTTKSVNEHVFKLAESLTHLGANPAFIAQNIKQRNSLAKLRLTARFLESLLLKKEGNVAIGEVTQEMFQQTGALRYDTTEFVEMLLDLHTVELAIFMLELPDEEYKFSLRSKTVDVSAIAHALGGGGHHHAAGLSVKKEEKTIMIEKIINEVIQ